MTLNYCSLHVTDVNGSIDYRTNSIAVELRKKLYIAEGVYIMFERYDDGWARLFFVNFVGLSVAVPVGVVVLIDSGQKAQQEVQAYQDTSSFLLSSDHSYVIQVGGEQFYKLEKHVQHNVSWPLCRTAREMYATQLAAGVIVTFTKYAYFIIDHLILWRRHTCNVYGGP